LAIYHPIWQHLLTHEQKLINNYANESSESGSSTETSVSLSASDIFTFKQKIPLHFIHIDTRMMRRRFFCSYMISFSKSPVEQAATLFPQVVARRQFDSISKETDQEYLLIEASVFIP